MEGKTLMFHLWYARALRRMASLHAEFAGDFGNAATATEYRDRADRVEESLRRLYWKGDHFVTNIDFQGKVADGTWCDDQVWAIAWGVATAEQAGRIWDWMNSDPARYEGVPMSWAAFDGPAHGRSSWFGRLGAGDILARFRSGQDRRAMELLHRISTIFARDRNIHEAYDMAGNLVQGSAGWGNYTEHAGGYYWSVVGGPFGIDFDPQDGALATVRPRFPSSWTQADAVFVVRGSHLRLTYTADRWTRKLTLEGEGEPRAIRVITPDGKIRILTLGPGKPKTVKY
jgi:hypothetical protein